MADNIQRGDAAWLADAAQGTTHVLVYLVCVCVAVGGVLRVSMVYVRTCLCAADLTLCRVR